MCRTNLFQIVTLSLGLEVMDTETLTIKLYKTTHFTLFYFSCICAARKVFKYGDFLVRIFFYLDLIQENKDQKKLRIWTLFTQS